MKNGNQITIETIKTIMEDLGEVSKIKFSFKEMTELINQCFDQTIFSNLVFQEIYTNNLLRETYKIHFQKENASDIEKGKG